MTKTLYQYAKEQAELECSNNENLVLEDEHKKIYDRLKKIRNETLKNRKWTYKNEEEFEIKFPFEDYSREQQDELVIEISKCLNDNKKTVDNFSKIDLDNIVWDKLRENIMSKVCFSIGDLSDKFFKPEEFEQLKNKAIFEGREIILDSNLNYLDTINILTEGLKNQYANFVERNNMVTVMGIECLEERLGQIDYLEKIGDDAFFQYIIKGIINNDELAKNKKINILKRIKEEISLIEEKILKKVENNSIKDIMKDFIIFLSQLDKRNELEGYLEVLRTLEDEMNKKPDIFEPIASKYQSNKRWIIDSNTGEELISPKELMDIVLEGDNSQIKVLRKNPNRFKKKCQRVIDIIKMFRLHGGRQLHENYLQHFRGVYREIFVSEIKFNRRTTKTIARNYVKHTNIKFNLTKEYLFLREKISRAMFREKNQLEEYRLKNLILFHFKNIYLKLYEYLDVDDIFNEMNNINLKLFGLLKQILIEEELI